MIYDIYSFAHGTTAALNQNNDNITNRDNMSKQGRKGRETTLISSRKQVCSSGQATYARDL